MNKKCIGCGSLLQNDDINKDGYVLDINDSICQRCFRIKYYNEYKVTSRNNSDYINIINSIMIVKNRQFIKLEIIFFSPLLCYTF